MASAEIPAMIPPIASGLRLCEVTVMGSGEGEVTFGAVLEMVDVVISGPVPVVVLVVLEVPVTEVKRGGLWAGGRRR